VVPVTSGLDRLRTSIAEIPVLAHEIEMNTARLEAVSREIAQIVVEEEIGGGYGVVVVDGSGSLRDVRLDRTAVRTARPATVARNVVTAIDSAETRIRRLHGERLADLSRTDRGQ
jgi:DNA-binding protein YbaB